MLSVMRNAAFLIAAATGLTPPSAELVAGTSLAGKNLECAYLASRDGWGASDFHRCVDDCGSTLVATDAARPHVRRVQSLGLSVDGRLRRDTQRIHFLRRRRWRGQEIPRPRLGRRMHLRPRQGRAVAGASDLIVGRPKAATMGTLHGPGHGGHDLAQGDTDGDLGRQAQLRARPVLAGVRDTQWQAPRRVTVGSTWTSRPVHGAARIRCRSRRVGGLSHVWKTTTPIRGERQMESRTDAVLCSGPLYQSSTNTLAI